MNPREIMVKAMTETIHHLKARVREQDCLIKQYLVQLAADQREFEEIDRKFQKCMREFKQHVESLPVYTPPTNANGTQ